MSRTIRILSSLIVGILFSTMMLFGQASSPFGAAAPRGSGSGTMGQGFGPGFGGWSPPVQSYFYPSGDWYGGYTSPFLFFPQLPPPTPYMPNYWWVSPYALADPRQDGYNPSAGYPKETVTTLLLTTYPAKTRVVLDGIYVGTSDSLGPFQLPVGEHTMRFEARGYEPSETVLKVERPAIEQLEIHLTPIAQPAKLPPRS